jgi:hypothetical protein
LNEFEYKKFSYNDYDYPSKKRKQRKDVVQMDQAYFIIYLSPRDVVLSRGMQK